MMLTLALLLNYALLLLLLLLVDVFMMIYDEYDDGE